MHITSEQRLDDGVLERGFTLGEVPGILWTPAPASAPAPLILVGHPGGLHEMHPRLAGRARYYAAEYGFAAAAIELPGRGDRPRSAAAEQARADLRRAIQAGGPGDDEIVDRLVVPPGGPGGPGRGGGKGGRRLLAPGGGPGGGAGGGGGNRH